MLRDRFFLFILLLLLLQISFNASALENNSAGRITVKVDPRIELLSVVMYLSDYTGFNGQPVLTRFDFPYKQEVIQRFSQYKNHPAVKLFDKMSAEGFWYGQPPEAILSYSEPPELKQVSPVSEFIIERAGGKAQLEMFISSLRDFAHDTDFMNFYRAHEAQYSKILTDYRAVMGSHDYIHDLENFYGYPQNSYTIIVAPFFHPGGFGPRIAYEDGKYDIYNLCGPWGYSNGKFLFGDENEFRRIVWHEFSHSYINHLTDQYMNRLSPAVDALNPGMKEKILASGQITFDVYAHEWVSEHIVRAVTTYFAYTVLGEEAGAAALDRETKSGYPYVEKLYLKLKEYESSRKKYQAFPAFFPELVTVFEQAAAATQRKADNPNPASIAILGVFHFAGSPGDAASMKVDGMLGERRQKEIEEVLVHLEKYKPDKILVEYPYTENEQLNKDYQNYLNGDLKLTADETHQLGFKLAQRLGHKKIYGVDHELSLPSDKLQEFAETHGQKEKFDKFIADVRVFAAKESKSLETLTILDCLTKMNTDESDRWNRGMYLGTILEMGSEESNPGVEFTEAWYKRNLFILSNILKTVEPGERILLIMGSGHRAMLIPFIKDKNDLRYDEIHAYLKGQ